MSIGNETFLQVLGDQKERREMRKNENFFHDLNGYNRGCEFNAFVCFCLLLPITK